MNIIQAIKAVFDLLKANYETSCANNRLLADIHTALTASDINFTSEPDAPGADDEAVVGGNNT